MKLNIILNRDNNNNIGINGELIYNILEDLKWFKEITIGNIIIMGYNTWKSLNTKPLKGRINIVISNNHYNELINLQNKPDYVYKSFESFISNYSYDNSNIQDNFINKNPELFIIGGSKVYEEAYKYGVDSIYETKCVPSFDIKKYWNNPLNLVKCDIMIDSNYIKTFYKPCSSEVYIYTNQNGDKGRTKVLLNYSFNIYRKLSNVNLNELSYLKLLNNIYINGIKRDTRNSEVISSFGEKMTFDLRDGFPLLTTKKMGFKTILRELLWFISGSTNNKELQKKNVHIWDGNSSTEYMNKLGLDYKDGELGPIYGFQWRNFGGDYNKGTKGFDQIEYMINLIKKDPTSRRIIMSSWNPPDLDKMALPPCHILFQIYVDGEFIDGQMYQRSGDMFLGVPFNIASYSLLLHIIGKITNKVPRYLYHILGDCHIYSNHYSEVEEQLKRCTYKSPTIKLSDEITDIYSINEDHIILNNYVSHPAIKASMVP